MHGVPLPPEFRRILEEQGRAKNTPAFAEGAVRVPAAAIGLPWIRYPRVPAACDAIVDQIDGVLSRATSGAQPLFWDSLRDVVSSIASRVRAS